jgi:hypothetical protein
MKTVLATLVGAALLASPADASTFILGGSAVTKSATYPQVEQTAWHGGWRHGWRGGGWGWWGPGAIIGGLAAGALAGSYYAYGPGYYGYYGPAYGYPYGPYGRCWRNAWGYVRCY